MHQMEMLIRLKQACALIIVALAISVRGDEFNHRYKAGDPVYFYVHKVLLLITR